MYLYLVVPCANIITTCEGGIFSMITTCEGGIFPMMSKYKRTFRRWFPKRTGFFSYVLVHLLQHNVKQGRYVLFPNR